MSFKPSRVTVECGISLCLLSIAMPSSANPSGGNVVAGSATVTGQGTNTVSIHQTSDHAIINWQDFSIAQQESTKFDQPTGNSVILNRVTGNNISEIMGNLSANGQVFIVNKNGIIFGKNAQVDVGGLVASTADISNADFMSGHYHFTNAPTGSSVINQGTITVKDAGLAALVAPNVENQGVIQAHLGRVAMGAGTAFTIDLYGDNLITFDATPLLQGVKFTNLNEGTLQADGGTVVLSVAAADQLLQSTLNTSGYISAKSVSQQNGKIILQGAGNTAVSMSGTVDASGGTLSVASANTSIDNNAATIYNTALNNNTHVIIKSDNDVNINTQQAISWNTNATLDIIADADHNATGTINITSGNIATTAGTINFYYNPTAFGTATTFAGVNTSQLGAFNPYMLINTHTQLQNMANNVTGAYALNTDLTLSAPFSSINNFSGKFTGNDFSITDLQIAQTANNAGLFGKVTGGMIRDVTLINPTITNGSNNSNTAAVIGTMSGGQLDGFFNIQGGSVTGGNNTAGIVGSFGPRATLGSDFTATNTANITGNSNVGGLFGTITRGAENIQIGALNNSGIISANNTGGGLIGNLAGAGISSSFFGADMNNTGNITGGAVLGGLIGAMSNITVSGTLASQANITGTQSLGGLMATLTNATVGSGSTVIGPDATHTIHGDAGGGGNAGNEGPAGGLFASITATNGQAISMDMDLINNANVVENRRDVGGIAGVLDGNVTLSGNLTNNGNITGNAQVGGIAGVIRNGATLGSISSSLINNGNIVGAHKAGNATFGKGGVGGILGDLGSSNGTSTYTSGYIAASTLLNTGSVTDELDRGAATNFGGIIGEVLYGSIGSAANVVNITNTDNVTPQDSLNTGGLVGQFNEYNPIGPVATLYANTLTNTGSETTQSHDRTGGAGGVFGALNYFNIQGPMNVLVSGDVIGIAYQHAPLDGGNRIGGFAGFVHGGVLSSASSPLSVTMTGNVEGAADTGGVIGYAGGTTINNATLMNTGNVTLYSAGSPSGQNFGGVFGNLVNSNATDTYMGASGTVSGISTVGGDVGNLQNSTITTAYFNGTVIGNQILGGIVGASSGNISDVIFGGTVQVQSYGSVAGGIVGMNTGTVTHALSGGNIIADSTTTHVGTVAGINNGALNNLFYSTDTFGALSNAVGGGTGSTTNIFSGDYTTLDFASTYTPYGWNFNNTWETMADHYVTLSWCGALCAIPDRHPVIIPTPITLTSITAPASASVSPVAGTPFTTVPVPPPVVGTPFTTVPVPPPVVGTPFTTVPVPPPVVTTTPTPGPVMKITTPPTTPTPFTPLVVTTTPTPGPVMKITTPPSTPTPITPLVATTTPTPGPVIKSVVLPSLPSALPSALNDAPLQFITVEAFNDDQLWLRDSTSQYLTLGDTFTMYRVHVKGYALPVTVAIPSGNLGTATTAASTALHLLSDN